MFWTTSTSGDGATTYTESQWNELLRDLFTPASAMGEPNTAEGVLARAGGELAVTGASSPVSVATGAAIGAGFYYRSDTVETVAIPTPAANTRVDRIVLRASYGTTRTVRITRIAGTEGAGAPSLTQSAGATWDIPLAQVSITTGGVITVTDQRSACHFATKVSAAMLDSGAAVANLGYTPWHAGNDGAGSGLDADLLDGQQGTYYWNPANDGDGSGLDADKVAGVDIAPIQRQGGSASAWDTAGSTNYSPTAMRIQTGVATVTINSGSTSGSVDITYPTAFSAVPNVLVGGMSSVTQDYTLNRTASGVRIACVRLDPTNTTSSLNLTVPWLAIGPS